MSNIQAFIKFWQQNETAPKHVTDSAKLLWEAHKRANAALHAAESETLRFIRPIRGSKGAMSIGFNPGSEDAVAGIANRITDAEKLISEVEAEIEEFMELAGSPSLLPIQAEVNREKSIVSEAIVSARKVRATEGARIRGSKARPVSEGEISSDPTVIAAVERESAVLAAHESKADALRERSVRAYSIASKYMPKAI